MHIAKSVKVLGTKYKIRLRTSEEDYELKECDGYCRENLHLIVVKDFRREDKHGCRNKKEAENIVKCSVRHEIVHAFLFESGLGWDSESVEHWAVHEEMVDWIARMGPKLHKAFKKTGCV